MPLLLLLLTFFFAGLSQAADSPPPNVVWINVEDISPWLGCYGDEYAITPNLDAFAKESILFENAFATAPICAPSRSCLITGLYATSMGSQHLRCEVTLPDSIKPFPKYLREAGYFCTNYAKTDYNFSPDGCFDYLKQDMAPWRQRKDTEQPFFSFFVVGDTHEGPGNFRDRYEAATKDLPEELRHDPAKAFVPPYYPDTPKMRELLARYADLITAMDREVAKIFANLKEDGLWDNTVVWFFSDHGHGLPRHKRWLNDSGLRVPLMIHLPKDSRVAGDLANGDRTDRLVSFVDFAPTVMQLAGLAVPSVMQGNNLLGGEERRYVFGARSRADDMFECSRAIHDGQYLYVRHYMPHLPYIQGGKIYSNEKEGFAELRRARDAGELNETLSLIWAKRKPVEEFYDLKADPYEVNNLAGNPEHEGRIDTMHSELRNWILRHRDTGFLMEAEYHRRADAAGTSIYEMAQSDEHYDLENILAAAEKASSPDLQPIDCQRMLLNLDSGVRFWGATGVQNLNDLDLESKTVLRDLLRMRTIDSSPAVAIAASESLLQSNDRQLRWAIDGLSNELTSDNKQAVLQAARSAFLVGDKAKRLVPFMQEVRQKLEAEQPSKRRYRDFNYASFTGWALEEALINCGAAKASDFE